MNCLFEAETNKSECKGLVFRGYTSNFHSKGKFSFNSGIKLLKRKSCAGCPQCEPMLDYLIEDVRSNLIPDLNDLIEDGQLYSLCWVEDGTDWETGFVDAHIQIYKIEDLR